MAMTSRLTREERSCVGLAYQGQGIGKEIALRSSISPLNHWRTQAHSGDSSTMSHHLESSRARVRGVREGPFFDEAFRPNYRSATR